MAQLQKRLADARPIAVFARHQSSTAGKHALRCWCVWGVALPLIVVGRTTS